MGNLIWTAIVYLCTISIVFTIYLAAMREMKGTQQEAIETLATRMGRNPALHEAALVKSGWARFKTGMFGRAASAE